MHFILSFITIFLISATPAYSGQINSAEITKAENYLKGLSTLRADFIQRSSIGSRLSGTFYLNRPGKLRFEYNEVDDFIVADGLFIYFYDSELEEQSNAPIGQTLADFLLREDLTLHGDMKVTHTYKLNGFVHLNIVQAADPAAGNVELIFSEIPYRLYKWRVTDPQGEMTEVELKNIEKDIDLASNLFGYVDPKHGKGHINE